MITRVLLILWASEEWWKNDACFVIACKVRLCIELHHNVVLICSKGCHLWISDFHGKLWFSLPRSLTWPLGWVGAGLYRSHSPFCLISCCLPVEIGNKGHSAKGDPCSHQAQEMGKCGPQVIFVLSSSTSSLVSSVCVSTPKIPQGVVFEMRTHPAHLCRFTRCASRHNQFCVFWKEVKKRRVCWKTSYRKQCFPFSYTGFEFHW